MRFAIKVQNKAIVQVVETILDASAVLNKIVHAREHSISPQELLVPSSGHSILPKQSFGHVWR